MAKKSDLEAHEWRDLIAFACIGASYKYSTSNFYSLGSLLGAVRELAAAHNFLADATDKYGKYELVIDVIIELLHADKSFLSDDIKEFSALEPIITRASQILAKYVTSEEASAMRAFSYELAFEIANAAGDGILSGGPTLSRTENEFLQELKRLLLLSN